MDAEKCYWCHVNDAFTERDYGVDAVAECEDCASWQPSIFFYIKKREEDRLREAALECAVRNLLERAEKAERERDEIQAQAESMRDALDDVLASSRWTDGVCVECGRSVAKGCVDVCNLAEVRERVARALSGDAGRGWVSPEEHARVLAWVAKLQAALVAMAEVAEVAGMARGDQFTEEWRSRLVDARTKALDALKEGE